jgi:hypothetical protein
LEVGFDVAGAFPSGSAGFADGVVARPAAVDGVLEDLVEEGEQVADGLGLEAVGEHGGADVFDVGRGDLGDRAVAEPRGRAGAKLLRPAAALIGRGARQAARFDGSHWATGPGTTRIRAVIGAGARRRPTPR